MKKFLSLVLSLAMTLSLVTISAGATDYNDLSDKGEIKYEEAVAVLNKVGIITGYEDGSFKPTGALTRGAAAKIIVSMMIGADAASALTVAGAPYKDVPVTNTFAAVISYCKTRGYINGYTDGTFRPTAALSGFAFTKMLLGALGYDGVQEGFTGLGWTMNVAALGNTAGLFNDFDPAFSGTGSVDRESACLLALNTLKATEVEYTGGTNITTTTGNATTSVSTKKERNYKLSNNAKINKNIKGQDEGNSSAYLTLQFGEDHFQDLRLENGNFSDDFGRPATKWSYKNVKIGTYALTPDYTFTKGPDGDTPADEVKDMGLKDFKFVDADDSHDGVQFTVNVNGADVIFGVNDSTDDSELDDVNSDKAILEFIADKMTGTGVQVEIYLEDGTADTIESVVVIYTQLMQVNSVKSSEVSLKKLDDTAKSVYFDENDDGVYNANDTMIYETQSVNSVKDDDDCYAALKDLKADDYVLVTPVVDTGSTYKAASVVVPQVVTGSLTNIKVKSNNDTVNGITIAGTAYSMSKMWSAEDNELTGSTKLNSSKDSTAYLDAFGNVIYATDVTASNSAIVIDEITSSLVDGKIVKYATGWDSNGNTLSLNLGTKSLDYSESWYQGKTFEYKSSTSNSAEYALVGQNAILVKQTPAATYVKNGDAYLRLDATDSSQISDVPFDSNVKFIFVTKDDDGDVTGITVHEGVTEVGKDGVENADSQYVLSYVYNKDHKKIVSVVVPNDTDAANTANLLYFQKVTNHTNNADGKRVAIFTAYIDGEKVTGCQLNKDIDSTAFNDKFYTYSKDDSTDVYTLSEYTKYDKTTSVASAQVIDVATLNNAYNVKTYITIGPEDYHKDLNAKNAKVIDLYTDDGKDYSSLKEMAESGKTNFKVSLIYNGNDDVTGYRTVSYIFITKNDVTVTDKYSASATDAQFSLNGTDWANSVSAEEHATVYVKSSATALYNAVTGGTVNGSIAVTPVTDKAYGSFEMPAADVTTQELQTATVTAGGYNAKTKQIYLVTNLTSPANDQILLDAVKVALEKQGYTDVSFTGTAYTKADASVSFKEGSLNIPAVVLDTNLIIDPAKVVSFKVDGVSYYGDKDSTTVAEMTGVAADAASFVQTNVGESVPAYVTTDSTKVAADKNYGTVEYVVFNETTKSGTGAAAYDVSYIIDGTAVTTAPGHVKAGVDVQIVLTAKADVTNTNNCSAGTASSVTFGSAGTGDVAFSGDSANVDSADTSALTFVNTNDLKIVASGDKVTSGVYKTAKQTAFSAITAAIVAPANS